MDNSHKAAFAFVFGVSLSDIIYVTIANLAANLLTELNRFSGFISLGGGMLLVVVGMVGLFSKVVMQPDEEKVLTIRGAHYFRIFASGFLINSINPGVIVSWLTAVSTCAGSPASYRFVLFSVCLAFILSVDLLKIYLAGKIRAVLTPKRMAQVKKVSSFIILLLGVILLINYWLHPTPIV
ncbi:MAG: hypothetical protein EBZ77_03745 [Chitinophagia bacterium]|nr:hypothetical protein [Chitinophagia bacterium]